MAETAPPDIADTPLDSWSAFIAEIDQMPGWIFRGQASANWSLMSTLERATPARYPRQFAEFNLAREFQRRARTYLQAHEVPNKPGEWLALMQHYGAPTRLLDFTRSPFVAAYFAFEDAPPDHCDRCAIWALEPALCLTHFGHAAIAAGGIFGKDLQDLKAAIEASRKPLAQQERSPEKQLGWDYFMLGSILAGTIDDNAQWKAPPSVAVFEPERLSARMSTQQGLFLWPGDITRSMMDNLFAFPITVGIRKFTIPMTQRGRALDQLRLMNITRTSLFQGLEGFAQSFRTALVQESQEDRRLRSTAHLVEQMKRNAILEELHSTSAAPEAAQPIKPHDD